LDNFLGTPDIWLGLGGIPALPCLPEGGRNRCMAVSYLYKSRPDFHCPEHPGGSGGQLSDSDCF